MPRTDQVPDETDPASKNGVDKTAANRSRKKDKDRKKKSTSNLPDSLPNESDFLSERWSALSVDGLQGKRVLRIVADCETHPLLWVSTSALRKGKIGKILKSAAKRPTLRFGSRRKNRSSWVNTFLESVVDGQFEALSQQNRNDAFNMLASAWLLGHSASQGTGKKDFENSSAQLLKQICSSADMFDELPHEDPVVWIWTQVELPLAIAAGFSRNNKSAETLANRAISRFETWLEDSVDEEGCLAGRTATDAAQVMASAFRIAALADATRQELSQRAQSRLDWMIRQFLLSSVDGGRMLFGNETVNFDRGLARLLLRLSPDSSDHRLIRHKFGEKEFAAKKLPDPCHYSENQGVGVLRSGWSADSCCIGLACDGTGFALDVARRKSLLKGQLETSWSLSGKMVLWDDLAWSMNCWNEDREIQYLELQLEHENGLSFQRQIVLLVKEQILFLGDALTGATRGRIDYRLNLPVADGVTALQEKETREIYLQRKGIKSLMIPATIGEWQRDHTDNAFSVMDDSIQFDQSMIGSSMYAAVAIDLQPRRSIKPRTWRPLTVGENLKPTSADVAVAGRFQFGREQWIYYRSLAEIGNRTFMGNNVFADFYIGRFGPDGEHDSLLMIEP